MAAWYHVYIKNSTTYDFVYMGGRVDAASNFGNGKWNRHPHDIKSQLGAPGQHTYAFDCEGTDGCQGSASFAILDPEADEKIGTLSLSWLVRGIGSSSASASVDSEAVRITRDERDDKGFEEVIHHVEVKQGI
ncbi:hypothetical protein [Marinobacter sp. F3R08]|uniref:hypothetical protein n=1 Tax=Marinobacter sp. F3R08 TaxID=2841559 RepID=UPI001C095CAE|nr:hypothetical protein [Marinobacter sp. F3R08]MBU2955835.1 hypothetical protein [Marinobacter sp. F3R08]